MLGTRGVQLMVFDFEGPNSIRSALYDCMFTRVGSATGDASHAGVDLKDPDTHATRGEGFCRQLRANPQKHADWDRCLQGTIISLIDDATANAVHEVYRVR